MEVRITTGVVLDDDDGVCPGGAPLVPVSPDSATSLYATRPAGFRSAGPSVTLIGAISSIRRCVGCGDAVKGVTVAYATAATSPGKQSKLPTPWVLSARRHRPRLGQRPTSLHRPSCQREGANHDDGTKTTDTAAVSPDPGSLLTIRIRTRRPQHTGRWLDAPRRDHVDRLDGIRKIIPSRLFQDGCLRAFANL